jgi:hypothetical protein
MNGQRKLMEVKMFNLIRLKDLAKELNIPESTIRTWKRRNEIPEECFKKIGSTVFVKVETFKKWIGE